MEMDLRNIFGHAEIEGAHHFVRHNNEVIHVVKQGEYPHDPDQERLKQLLEHIHAKVRKCSMLNKIYTFIMSLPAKFIRPQIAEKYNSRMWYYLMDTCIENSIHGQLQ